MGGSRNEGATRFLPHQTLARAQTKAYPQDAFHPHLTTVTAPFRPTPLTSLDPPMAVRRWRHH